MLTFLWQPDGRSLVAKLLVKYPAELDVVLLHKILKAHWRGKQFLFDPSQKYTTTSLV